MAILNTMANLFFSILSIVAIIVYLLIPLIIGYKLLQKNNTTIKTQIMWLLIILFSSYLGLLAYYIYQESQKK